MNVEEFFDSLEEKKNKLKSKNLLFDYIRTLQDFVEVLKKQILEGAKKIEVLSEENEKLKKELKQYTETQYIPMLSVEEVKAEKLNRSL